MHIDTDSAITGRMMGYLSFFWKNSNLATCIMYSVHFWVETEYFFDGGINGQRYLFLRSGKTHWGHQLQYTWNFWCCSLWIAIDVWPCVSCKARLNLCDVVFSSGFSFAVFEFQKKICRLETQPQRLIFQRQANKAVVKFHSNKKFHPFLQVKITG